MTGEQLSHRSCLPTSTAINRMILGDEGWCLTSKIHACADLEHQAFGELDGGVYSSKGLKYLIFFLFNIVFKYVDHRSVSDSKKINHAIIELINWNSVYSFL